MSSSPGQIHPGPRAMLPARAVLATFLRAEEQVPHGGVPQPRQPSAVLESRQPYPPCRLCRERLPRLGGGDWGGPGHGAQGGPQPWGSSEQAWQSRRGRPFSSGVERGSEQKHKCARVSSHQHNLTFSRQSSEVQARPDAVVARYGRRHGTQYQPLPALI